MLTSIFDSVMKEASIAPIVAEYNAFVEGLGGAFNFLLVALCLVVALFGRRLSGIIRVVLLFVIGFVASVYWVAPIITQVIPSIPAIGIGIAVGIFAAVLSRMIYNFVYVGCIGFDVYNICLNALFIVELTSLTKGNVGVSLVVAIVAVIIALLLRKYLEMLITAGLGAFGIAYFMKEIVDYTASINLDSMTTVAIVAVIVAIPCFIYQFYNRVIY